MMAIKQTVYLMLKFLFDKIVGNALGNSIF